MTSNSLLSLLRRDFHTKRPTRILILPLIIAIGGLLLGGIFLLEKADRQARDTTRKHHIEDIEQSLYFARTVHGTYPPYDTPTWCGVLSASKNSAVLAQVEAALRQQHEQYANEAKPFPTDPKFAHTDRDYFYWKRSPTAFELYAVLEENPTGERNTGACANANPIEYDYGITSTLREPGSAGTLPYSIL